MLMHTQMEYSSPGGGFLAKCMRMCYVYILVFGCGSGRPTYQNGKGRPITKMHDPNQNGSGRPTYTKIQFCFQRQSNQQALTLVRKHVHIDS